MTGSERFGAAKPPSSAVEARRESARYHSDLALIALLGQQGIQ